MGGAFAPPLKDLCRFLKENPEYGVAPEWGDVVKQSVSIYRMNNNLIYDVKSALFFFLFYLKKETDRY